jgi:membrane protein
MVHLRAAAAGWVADDASSMGAALAYYCLFSIAPIVIIALAVVGSVAGPDVAQQQVLSQIPSLVGTSGAAAVRDLVLSAHYSSQKGIAALVGVIAALVGATSVFQELQQALEKIWKSPAAPKTVVWRRFLRVRVLSIGLLVGIGFLLLVSLLASAALNAFSHWLGGLSHRALAVDLLFCSDIFVWRRVYLRVCLRSRLESEPDAARRTQKDRRRHFYIRALGLDDGRPPSCG